MFAKFDQFLPVRSHFDTKRPVNFFHIATFPSPTFGPLFAFHCPLFFFTKNNNLECRDVLKTVTVTCVCVQNLTNFCPYSHLDTKRPVNFFHIATFPSPTFGPLFAFHCPLFFFTKNNNLECRDVLKTVTVTCVCVQNLTNFCPYSHLDTKRPVNFFHIATFPSPTFGPLFAFHCPLFFYEKQ